MTDSRRIEVVVRDLARSHFETEESVEQIIWVRDGDERERGSIPLPPGWRLDDVEVFERDRM